MKTFLQYLIKNPLYFVILDKQFKLKEKKSLNKNLTNNTMNFKMK